MKSRRSGYAAQVLAALVLVSKVGRSTENSYAQLQLSECLQPPVLKLLHGQLCR